MDAQTIFSLGMITGVAVMVTGFGIAQLLHRAK